MPRSDVGCQVEFQLVVLALERLEPLVGGSGGRPRLHPLFEPLNLGLLVGQVHLLAEVAEQ
jgi:hypothetical protein